MPWFPTSFPFKTGHLSALYQAIAQPLLEERPTRPGQLTPEDLPNLPIGTEIILRFDHLSPSEAKECRFLGFVGEEQFRVSWPGQPGYYDMHKTDYCLAPYIPSGKWHPTNWVEVIGADQPIIQG